MEGNDILKDDFGKFWLDASMLDVATEEVSEDNDMPEFTSVDDAVAMVSEVLPWMTDNEFAEFIIWVAQAYKGVWVVDEVDVEIEVN